MKGSSALIFTRVPRTKRLFAQACGWLFAVTFLVLVNTGPGAKAQQNAETPTMTPVNSANQPANDNRYRIGPGDVLSILVRKAPELTATVRVDQRGMIRIPMVEGEIVAACKTESELASEITSLYLEYKRNPSIDVFVSEFQSRPVAVIGAVNSPGQFRLQRQVRLLELLSFAGGPSARAGRVVEIIHTGQNLCKVDKPQDEAQNHDLGIYALNETLKGKDESNPYIAPGDIVSLPEADQVFVIGHVLQPQAISLRDKPITISRAIAMTGGPARDAKTSKIRIVRQLGEGQAKQEIFVDLNAVLKQKQEDIVLMANDIVEVPSSLGKTILNTLQGSMAPALSQLPIRVIP